MLVSIVAFIAFAQTPEAPKPSAGKLITTMLAHYSGIKKMVGEISLKVVAGKDGLSIGTQLAFERPSLVGIRLSDLSSLRCGL